MFCLTYHPSTQTSILTLLEGYGTKFVGGVGPYHFPGSTPHQTAHELACPETRRWLAVTNKPLAHDEILTEARFGEIALEILALVGKSPSASFNSTI